MFFFFNDTATTEIYTLSLHDALPILAKHPAATPQQVADALRGTATPGRVADGGTGSPNLLLYTDHGIADPAPRDRKSTRLNSSHANISYAVFCLKKKKTHTTPQCHSL